MQYDIIIALQENSSGLRRCLDALANVDFPLSQLHLFLADCSADGRFAAECRAQSAEPHGFGSVTPVPFVPGESPAAAKNRAAALGCAPRMLFLHPDAAPVPELFSALDDAAADPQTAAFECRCLPIESAHACDPVTLETDVISGDVFAVCRSAFQQAGGFDPLFPDVCSAQELSLRLRAAGFVLRCVPKAAVVFDPAPACTDTLDDYAGRLYAALLMPYKFGSFGEMVRGGWRYLCEMRHPVHFDGVRRVLCRNYLHHFGHLASLLRWRASHRKERRAAHALQTAAPALCRGRFALVPPAHLPLVSVIVRTCSRPETLRRTLQSLRSQTYRNFEIIVAEDGAPAAKEMLAAEFSDLPIVYLNDGVRRGRAENGNHALAAAHGSLCNFLDDDDFFYPDHLELLVSVLEQHPEADLVLGSAGAMFVSRTGQVTELRPMVFDRIDRFTMCQDCRIPIQTVLFRRSLFEQYGGMPAGLNAHEDWAMWLKYLEHAKRITPHRPDVCRITSLFVQPADPQDAAARMAAYGESDDAFFSDDSLRFTVSLADMRRYYDDMIRDMRCLEERGELHDFLQKRSERFE